ncbi:MAG TPA: hypothetical protein VK045_05095 [Ornithinicoccus sp.]|nr:hypothetical protein [Ornithinicoccus sp.]
MCYPLDIDVAMDAHVERTHTLEVENRLALRDTTQPRAFLKIRRH